MNAGSTGFDCLSAGWLYFPSAFACQISIMPSGTAMPFPSSMVQISFIRSPFALGPAIRGVERGPVRPIRKNGPTVCDANGTRRSLFFLLLVFKRSFLRTAQDDIEFVSQSPIGLR